MRYIPLLLILAVFSCIPTYKLSRPHLLYKDKKGSKPGLATKSTVKKGDILYSEFKYKVNPAVELDKKVTTTYRDVGTNVRLSKMRKGKQTAYGTVSISDRSVTYLRDLNNDGKFDQILVQARHNATNWTDINPKVSYHPLKGIRSETEGYQLDLIYQGMKDSTITALYKEYQQNLTAPSSTQKIHYRLGSNKDHLFDAKGAQIKVIRASDKTMTYKVIKGFSG